MAACLITYTGTGLLQIDYKLSDVPYNIRSNGGPLYIDDAATDVTYTTLSGNITATSGCLTITVLPYSYFKWGWRDIQADEHHAIGVIFNDEEMLEFDNEVSFPETTINLVREVNAGIDDRYKIFAYRRVSSGSGGTNSVQYDYIVRTIGATEIYLVVENDDGEDLYINGDPIDPEDIPDLVGYTVVSFCYPQTLLEL